MARRPWRAHEFGLLWPRYLTEGPARLAAELDRTEDSVTAQANRIGMRSLTRRQRQALTRRIKTAGPTRPVTPISHPGP
jgi:hypothetical protein